VLKARKYIKERDVLYITDASGGGRSAAEEVLKMNPRAIIAEKGKISHLAREALRDMIIIPPEKLEIKVMDEFGIVGRAALEEEIRKGEEKVKVKEAIRKEKWLETFITEYREERKRELK
jgi:predicted RNase H-like nuclease (RuvC/YqgF family)